MQARGARATFQLGCLGAGGTGSVPRASHLRGRGPVGSRCRTSPKNVPVPVTSAAAQGGCATLLPRWGHRLMLAPLLQAGGARGWSHCPTWVRITGIPPEQGQEVTQQGKGFSEARATSSPAETLPQPAALDAALSPQHVVTPKPASKSCCTTQEAPSPSALHSTCDKDHFADLQFCGITRLSMPGVAACAVGDLRSLSFARPLPM